MILNNRDQDTLDFIKEFHVATSKQIHRMFFRTSYRFCLFRLQQLVENGFLKWTKSTIDNCHAFYLENKPVQLHHDLIRAELYTHLMKRFAVREWHNEQPIGNIRPDALCYVLDHGITFPVVTEIHLSKSFDFDKYKFDLTEYLGPHPRVIICTDRKVTVPAMPTRFKVVGLDMKGLDTILK